MTYKLKFVPSALKEWEKLGDTVRKEFKKALEKRVINPCIPKQKLSGFSNIYKIKLRSAGYRLVYEVIEKEVVILVLAVAKRDKDEVYDKLSKRKVELTPV
ncbi:MAG: type II toxin-antitoxin system RelE/ParE family toxin [Proteobacteria bacterium]|nr:type II toxin-antitoxin system RelE/ParE family toxin [Pseudomonadota bacterium]